MKLHLANIAKWVKIVQKSGNNRAALIKANEDEVYGKVKF